MKNNNEIKRCVVYARYSSDNQREVSAEEQVRICKEFIANNGYVTIALNIFYILGFTDKVHSFENEKRPPLDFHQMVVWNGGGEGNRTPVRKPIHETFSGRIRLFEFPFHAGKRHSAWSGSFINS